MKSGDPPNMSDIFFRELGDALAAERIADVLLGQ